MAEQTFELVFDGYWREPNKGGIPDKSGVYCVYECTHDETEKNVTIHRLIYIGQGENVRTRVANHEKWNDWKKYVRGNNQLCFSFAPVDKDTIDRIEAALIFKHTPPENTEYIDSFPFDKTTIISEGRTFLLYKNFTVDRK